ncbi:MAG TPA: SDR family NAD(P)-dependent oxidoreductase [Chloroflexota bacterium]|jgi:NAD(P)-dependent dehydrogenase (short-subunit alcohol dehydrogenase family)|nr:SDR family NAD(P)-dependent oxidoreductase [Chloroflexota bacterium]
MSAEAKVALITGAARGIGAATARLFLERGYSVAATDILNPEAQPSTGASGVSYRFWQCDVSRESEVARLVELVTEEFGTIDVLVNIAGVVLVKPLHETSWEEFERLVHVNLGGTFLLCKYTIPIMMRRQAGSIVNLGSVSGHVGQTDHALYGSTKAAVIALCRALAWELAPYHIRVNSISPGSVDTPMLRGDIEIEAGRTGLPYGEVKARREAEQAFGRWADPSEIAEAIYFVAGNNASFVTGADLLVDGGWVAR